MKKLYVSALIAVLCASGAPATGKRFCSVKNKATKNRVIKRSPVRSEGGGVWRPSSQTDYMYDDGEWIKLGTVSFEYDNEGKVLTETTVYATEEDIDASAASRRNFTYDRFGQIVSMIETVREGESWTNFAKTEYEWDPVVHDFFTSRMGYDWSASGWEANYRCETDQVTRNADGNVTEVIKSLPLGNSLVPAYKLSWTYGDDGQATEYRFFENRNAGNPAWELEDGIMLSGIEWNRTDGQLLSEVILDLFSGANRLSHVETYVDGELDGHIIAEYYEDRPEDYFVKNTFNDPSVIGATMSKTVTDEYGSYRIEDALFVNDEDEVQTEPVETQTYEIEFDSHGNIMSEKISEVYEDVEHMAGYRYDNVYDEDGNLTEYTAISLFTDDDGEIAEEYEVKTVFGEYIDVAAGVTGVISDAAKFPARVYSMQGIYVSTAGSADEINTLPAGLYIVNGHKVSVR